MVMDGVFGFTRTDMLARPHTDDCWGELLGVKNSCQPPLSRATAIPQDHRVDLPAGRRRRAARLSRSAVERRDEFRLDQGRAQREVRRRDEDPPSEPLRDADADVHVHGGRTALAPAGPNDFNAFADFLLGEMNARTSESMTPMIGDEPTVEDIMDFRPATLRSNQYGVYVRDQFELNRKMTVSAGLRWEYYPLSQRADRGLEVFDFESRQLLICGVSGNATRAGSPSRRICSRRVWAGPTARQSRPSSASGIRAIRRTTRRAATRCHRSRRFRPPSSWPRGAEHTIRRSGASTTASRSFPSSI